MLILCWNVASWATTYAQIKSHYGGVTQFLDRHQADILCLQETKITRDKLSADPRIAEANAEGWDTFWACCRVEKKGAQGFNGVATFARKGLTVSANPEPFGDDKLDSEGRCIMTDHGTFVLFNVYAPTNGGGQRIPFKVRFLNTLRQRMREQRAAGKAVILVGDLNIARRKQDVFWKDRILSLDWLQSEEAEEHLPLPLVEKLRTAHRPIMALLESIEIVKVPGKVNGGSQFTRKTDSWKVVAGPDGKITLGRRYDSPERAKGAYDLRELTVEGDNGTHYLIWPKNTLTVDQICELVTKSGGVPLTDDEVKALTEVGGPYAAEPFRRWMDAIMNEDGMVDAFAHFHPNARERFTCWEQYTNRRYENEGARIDYTFVDREFFKKYARSGPPLGGITNVDGSLDNQSPQAALKMVTANGLWQPAPFDGSGIVDAPRHVYDTQFAPPHTGIIYTPPRYSDHAGVSLVLDMPLPTLKLVRNASTTRAQPHTGQASIKSMFASAAVKATKKTESVQSEPRTAESSQSEFRTEDSESRHTQCPHDDSHVEGSSRECSRATPENGGSIGSQPASAQFATPSPGIGRGLFPQKKQAPAQQKAAPAKGKATAGAKGAKKVAVGKGKGAEKANKRDAAQMDVRAFFAAGALAKKPKT